MSKLEQLIQDLCLDGVEYKRLGEIGEVAGAGADKLTKPDEKKVYLLNYMDVYRNRRIKCTTPTMEVTATGREIAQCSILLGDIFITPTSETIDDIGHAAVAVESIEDAIYSYHLMRIRLNKKIALPFFIAYLFESDFIQKQIIKSATGLTRYGLSKSNYEKLLFPLPPLPVQQEIVRILDTFTELTSELTSELTARKKQYEYYRDRLMFFSDNVISKPIGEAFPFIRNGFVGTVTPFFTDGKSGVRYLQGTNIHKGIISDDQEYYVTKEFHKKHIRNELKSTDILIVQSGHVGECAVVGENYEGANCHALIIMSNGGSCNSRFVVHYLQSTEGIKKLNAITTGGTIKHILASKIKNVTIPMPPLEEQERVVAILDRFDALCNDLTSGLPAEIEARKKQYEYYRDKLLTFEEKPV